MLKVENLTKTFKKINAVENVSFEVDQVVDFNGQKHQIKTVEPLYDNSKLHHYEIGMVRYGKD